MNVMKDHEKMKINDSEVPFFPINGSWLCQIG
jgi:hypothetical protein